MLIIEKLINFHSKGSFSELPVASRSECICTEHPNRINLSSPFNEILSCASHFRLVYQISVWRCKFAFSTAIVSIKHLKMVWFDFNENGKSN